MAFLYLNGQAVPYPYYESGLQTTATLVDGGRMADGVFRGKKIGRDQSKVELQWAALRPEEWASILRVLESSFVVSVRYYDMVQNGWITRSMYCSDRTARPYMVDPNTGRPRYFLDCSVNLIDTGE